MLPMNRAVEIINSLRAGMKTLLKDESERRVNSLRMFNFEKNRVSLRMEIIDNENVSHPMGMIDVTEYPTGDRNQASCNCHLTDLASGKTERLVLKLNSRDQKKIESTKIFNFFRAVLNLPESTELENLETGTHDPSSEEKTDPGSSESLFPPTGGKLPEHPRGAQ